MLNHRLTTILALLLAQTTTADEPPFRPLVEGDDVRQFSLVKLGPDSMTIRDGEIRLSGRPFGYFATKPAYHNYVLRFEWMYERPEGLGSDAAFRGNSGVLVHIREPHKVWPACVEVQLLNADVGDTFAIPPSTFRGRTDVDAQKRAVKPIGEWNATEITCRDGSIVVTVNGVEVARGTGANPDGGPIGWQSEGSPVRFRRIEIRAFDIGKGGG
jgi:hypothetical protein